MKSSGQPVGPAPEPPGESGQAPSGTVTFLFSDIEGSTRLLSRLKDRYADVLEAQQRLLRTAFAAWGGREIDTAGDGFFVVFSRARDAVAAAAAAQRALAEHPWPPEAAVRVRMGLHTGEPVLAAGGYVGIDVHRAARICGAGHGGQVLLSQTTRELAEAELPQGVSLRDLGEHRLKDLPHSERLAQLVVDGLPADFPPLRTSVQRPHNLPPQPSPLVGREEEIRTIRHLLLRDAVRLVTLTGPGGTGKTRLALEAAAGLQDAFEDGVFFVPLASITDPALVPSSLCMALGATESTTRPVLDHLKDFLRDRHLLLVLDNFEQVVAAAPGISELLAAAPRLKVLVTSRIVLHLSSEYEYQVPALALPDLQHLPAPDVLPQFSAIALFVQRAQAVRAGFTLTEDNAAAVARICAYLEGLPLALELAAARLKLFSPQAMLTRLGSRLDLLKGGARDLHPRHQTLRHAIAWSYDLLNPEEQAYFRRLSVFMDGCTLEAAGEVCNALNDLSLGALDAVATLVDQSLLRQEDGPGDEPRFVMLETIREFGAECLQQSQDEAPTRRAHALYFLALAEQAEPELTGPAQAEWLSRLEAEHNNLRAALSWAVAREEVELGLRLGGALWRFWTNQGHLQEGRERLEQLLSLPAAQARTAGRARALNGVGTLIHEISDYTGASVYLQESLSIWRELGDPRGIATALNNLGWVATNLGDGAAARAYDEEALALFRQLGDARGIAVALHNLGWAAFQQSDYALGRSLLEETLSYRREAGDLRGYAYDLSNIAWVDQVQGLYPHGLEIVDESLTVLRRIGDRQITIWALQIRARILTDLGHFEEARALLEECAAGWREVDNRAALAWTLLDLGKLLSEQGALDRARTILHEARTLWEGTGSPWGLAHVLSHLGRLALREHAPDRAYELFQACYPLWRGLGDRYGLAECLEGFARLAIGEGAHERAARLGAAAERLREEIGAPVPPYARPALERDRATLLAALGEEAFAVAKASGRAMTPEELDREIAARQPAHPPS